VKSYDIPVCSVILTQKLILLLVNAQKFLYWLSIVFFLKITTMASKRRLMFFMEILKISMSYLIKHNKE